MDKKLKKIFIILLIFLVIIFFISTIIFKKEDSNSKENSYIDEKNNSEVTELEVKYTPQVETKYSKIMNSQEKKQISSIITGIVELLNTKDFESLYSKLSEVSKTNYYPTFEEFEKEFSNKTLDASYKCDGYIRSYYGYDCAFYPTRYNQVANQINFIIKLKDKDYELILNRLVDETKRGAFKVFDGMTVIFDKELQYLEKTGYVFTFKNNLNSNMTIDFTKVYATEIINGYEYTNELDNVETLNLKPQESKTIELEFNEYGNLAQKPTWFNLNLKINGKECECTFYLNYEEFSKLSEVKLWEME